MERKDFFALAQRVAIMTDCCTKLPEDMIFDLIVKYNGVKYYPQAMQIGYNSKGEVVNVAILHDLHQNSVTYARLENVVQSVQK